MPTFLMFIPNSSSDLDILLRRRKQPMAEHLLSCGLTLGNLAVSGSRRGAFETGCYYLMPGDSDSGKTVVCLTTLACATEDPYFDDYNLVFDNAENGAKMNIRNMFGKKVARRIRPPEFNEDKIGSETVEEMYDVLQDELAQPCIYILDSQDALIPEAERKRYAKNKRARQKGGEIEQSYGTEKARLHSQGLRTIVRPMQKSKSIVIFIAQSRIDPAARFGDKRTRGGGKALKFFCTAEIWTTQIKELRKEIKGLGIKKTEQIGIQCKIKVKRSRGTGQHRAFEFPIYWEYGIDDIGSCVAFLLEWGHWKKRKGMGIDAHEFNFEGTEKNLVRFIESQSLEDGLKVIVAKLWRKINDALTLNRKKRFE